MKKRFGQASIFIIVALILVAGIVLVGWLKGKDVADLDVRECESDIDCVPAECCNARLCVSRQDAPNCSDPSTFHGEVMCPLGCFSYLYEELGCRDSSGNAGGWCQCVNQKCEPFFP